MAKQRLHLLIIDPQNDFCDLPISYRPEQPMDAGGSRLAPSLPVPGAHGDILRLASLITEGLSGLTDITLTLDTHQRLDIAHPGFWVKGDGSTVSPFTQITANEVRLGAFLPRLPGSLDRVLSYLETLEAAGHYTHMVWPVHCEIGTWGHNVHADLQAACNAWEEETMQNVNRVIKGINPWTEHFSAIMAEVPDPLDASTQLNRALLESLMQADQVFIAGEAGSHCVKSTTEHIAHHLGNNRSKLVLIEDCMSPVPGFEANQSEFLNVMRAKGLRVTRSTDVLRDLMANRSN